MKWLKWCAPLLLLIFLPQILSSPLGKSLFIRSIQAKVGGTVTIGSLHLSWFGPQTYKNIQFSHPPITATAEELETHAPLWALGKVTNGFVLKNGTLSYLQTGTIEQIDGKVQNGQFEVQGTTRNGALSLNGTFASTDHFAIAINLANFPSATLDSFYPVSPLLGPLLNLQGAITEGTIDLTLNSTNIRTAIKGTLSDHSFKLTQPLDASILLTPELSNYFPKNKDPLFRTITSLNPALLHINATDFFFPLNPFSLASLHLSGSLDLQKLECTNGKTMASLISLLKTDIFAQTKKMPLWTTPFSFKIENGIFQMGRMDALLANSIHICTWGSVDFLHDQLSLYLGLPADTLQRHFKIQNLPPLYVLKIPIRGSIQDPELVKGQATAKIATLIASEQLPQKGFFGGLVNAFTQTKEDKDVPPPHHPFPWE